MKVVINACFGGFHLSPKAVKRLAELQGRKCYFFKHEYGKDNVDQYSELTLKQATEESIFWSAFDIPSPNEVLKDSSDWNKMTEKQKDESNEIYEQHSLPAGRELDRTDPLLIQVVRELGKEANTQVSELKIVEIPDGTDYEIDEYDGNESIHEKHRSWS